MGKIKQFGDNNDNTGGGTELEDKESFLEILPELSSDTPIKDKKISIKLMIGNSITVYIPTIVREMTFTKGKVVKISEKVFSTFPEKIKNKFKIIKESN